jgi:hypothetical protein
LVTAAGSRRYIIRTKIKGWKRRELGLGSLHDVAIDEARAKASEMRRSARQGCDPTIERRVRAAKAVPFRQAFESYFDNKRQSLGNAKHLAQWVATMEAYVFPRIGDRPVAEIQSGEVIEVLAGSSLHKGVARVRCAACHQTCVRMASCDGDSLR